MPAASVLVFMAAAVTRTPPLQLSGGFAPDQRGCEHLPHVRLLPLRGAALALHVTIEAGVVMMSRSLTRASC